MQFSTAVAKTKKPIPTWELILLPVNTAVKLTEHSKLFLSLEMSVQV